MKYPRSALFGLQNSVEGGRGESPVAALGLSLDGVVRISVEIARCVGTSLEMELPVAEGDSDRSG
jgi:hypothetical protein